MPFEVVTIKCVFCQLKRGRNLVGSGRWEIYGGGARGVKGGGRLEIHGGGKEGGQDGLQAKDGGQRNAADEGL